MLSLLALLACVKTPAPVDSQSPLDSAPPPAPQVLVVSGYNSDALHLFDPDTGASLGSIGPVPGAQSVRPAPGGGWLVVAEKDGAILHLDAEDGTLSTRIPAGSGLQNPTSAITSPGGEIWVGDFGLDQVLRFSAEGQALGVLTDGEGLLDGPDAGMLIGPDGQLYVPGFDSDNVLRVDVDTGAVLGVLASAADGLSRPRVLQVEGDALLVSSWGGGGVLRFAPESGLVGRALSARTPTGFLRDEARGWWLVANDQTDRVARYDLDEGEFIDTFIEGGEGGLLGATFVALIEAPWLR
ncbi:MAG: hypothetical protein H6741_16705 [Alphaproteobacteria bacterium]|nr:hypothetical protein [Alphaproteobacteria bacterium]MCB9794356.1 hypothetical protein [Alphaproteobacteria bacterium]